MCQQQQHSDMADQLHLEHVAISMWATWVLSRPGGATIKGHLLGIRSAAVASGSERRYSSNCKQRHHTSLQ